VPSTKSHNRQGMRYLHKRGVHDASKLRDDMEREKKESEREKTRSKHI